MKKVIALCAVAVLCISFVGTGCKAATVETTTAAATTAAAKPKQQLRTTATAEATAAVDENVLDPYIAETMGSR